jgi:signal transduction histidine kinase
MTLRLLMLRLGAVRGTRGADLARRASPPATDAALAAGLTVWGLLTAVGDAVAVGVLSALLMTAPLAWRRRAPLVVVVLGSLGFAMQALPSDPPEALSTLVAFLVGVFTAAARLPLGRAALALAVAAAAGVAESALAGSGDIGFILVLTGLAWGAGRAVGVRARRASAAERETARAVEQSRARAQEAVRAEREQIARELHDSVAHSVSLMVVQSGAAEQLLRDDPERAGEMLRKMQQAGRDSVADLHRMLQVLRSSEDDGAARGVADVPDLVAAVRAAGTNVDLALAMDPARPLAPGLDRTVYRIVQEALTNVVRHAPGAQTAVRIAQTPTEVDVTVDNEPAGDATPRASAGTGNGLVGMRERAALFGGRVDARPVADGGFHVQVRLPLPSGVA